MDLVFIMSTYSSTYFTLVPLMLFRCYFPYLDDLIIIEIFVHILTLVIWGSCNIISKFHLVKHPDKEQDSREPLCM